MIENVFLNDNSISGHKLQAAVMASTGATLSLRSIQRAKQKLVDTSDVQQASLMSSSDRTYVSWRNILLAW